MRKSKIDDTGSDVARADLVIGGFRPFLRMRPPLPHRPDNSHAGNIAEEPLGICKASDYNVHFEFTHAAVSMSKILQPEGYRPGRRRCIATA
jgi:hypothetical protein